MYARVMTPLKGGSLMSKFIAAVFTCAFAFVITSISSRTQARYRELHDSIARSWHSAVCQE
jgi:hypothetical protein